MIVVTSSCEIRLSTRATVDEGNGKFSHFMLINLFQPFEQFQNAFKKLNLKPK
jgi:hypothetical protein